MMDKCKTCDGHGLLLDNNRITTCSVCDGYGYIGQPTFEDAPLTFKQGLVLVVVAIVVIFIVIQLGPK